jgi:hypothetical protein
MAMTAKASCFIHVLQPEASPSTDVVAVAGVFCLVFIFAFLVRRFCLDIVSGLFDFFITAVASSAAPQVEDGFACSWDFS